jgi:hypothetical protein
MSLSSECRSIGASINMYHVMESTNRNTVGTMLNQAAISAYPTSRRPGRPRKSALPPLPRSPHNQYPQTTAASGCIWLPIAAIILLLLGGIWYFGFRGAESDPVIAGPEETPTAEEVIAEAATPTHLPETTSTAPTQTEQEEAPASASPRPTDPPEATRTSPSPTAEATATPASPSPTAEVEAAPVAPEPTETPIPADQASAAGLHSVTTARALDNRFRPVQTTSTFSTNEQFYVSYQINDAEAGQPITFRCYFNDQLCWEWTEPIGASGSYVGYFLVGPFANPGAYRGEITYRGETYLFTWQIQ